MDAAPTHADLAQTRLWFAQELAHVAAVRSPAVVAAFANVPREYFVGAGPWRLLSPMRSWDYWWTPDADPRHLYHDILVAIDATRRLNNGQPSLWASLFDQLDLTAGARVIHVGAGTGYYSAILSDIVGAQGEVTAIEIDPDLAARARHNLGRAWPQANVLAADGFAFRPGRPVDAIIVNAGVSHLSPAWLDSLAAQNGRLLVPLTNKARSGFFLLITRLGEDRSRYRARCVSRTGIFACIGGRDEKAEAKLEAAMAAASFTEVQSLRRAPEQPDATCWLEGEGWWLSTEPA